MLVYIHIIFLSCQIIYYSQFSTCLAPESFFIFIFLFSWFIVQKIFSSISYIFFLFLYWIRILQAIQNMPLKSSFPVLFSAVALSLIFRRLRKIAKATISFVMSVCLSVRPHRTTRLPFYGCSFKMIFEYISKICQENSCFINLLKPTGYVMHQQFNIQQLYVLPTLYLFVLCLSENNRQSL